MCKNFDDFTHILMHLAAFILSTLRKKQNISFYTKEILIMIKGRWFENRINFDFCSGFCALQEGKC